MNRRLHLVIALIVLAALLPPAALAAMGKPKHHHNGTDCNSGGVPSAVCVYVEGAHGPGGSRPIGTGTGKGQPLSKYAMSQLTRYGGKDRRVLETLATSPAFLATHFGHSPGGGAGSSSSGGLLAALDLGTGPLALFATLLAGAVALAGGRVLRRRRALR